jgi:hypothetical protein
MQANKRQLTEEFDEIQKVISLYMEGSVSGDVPKLRQAFHKDARMFGSLGGKRYDIPIEEFFALAQSEPAGPNYKGRILSLNQVNDAATVTLAEDGFWGSISFVDFFALSKFDGAWKIVNKTFAHTGGELPSP